MRRMTDMDVIREKKGLLIVSVLLILLSLFVILSPYLWPEESRVVYTSEVTVKELGHHFGMSYSRHYDYIRTIAGEKYILSGEYWLPRLEEQITEGSVVTVKWSKGILTPWERYATELYMSDVRIMAPETGGGSVWPFVIVMGFFMAVGVGGILLVYWHVRRNRRMQEMRNKRIGKKYGHLRK